MKILLVKQILTLTTKMPIVAMLSIQKTELAGSQELSAHPVRPAAKPTTLQHFFGANSATRPPPRYGRPTGQSQRQRQVSPNKPNESVQAAAQNLH